MSRFTAALAPSDELLVDAFYAPCGYALAWTSERRNFTCRFCRNRNPARRLGTGTRFSRLSAAHRTLNAQCAVVLLDRICSLGGWADDCDDAVSERFALRASRSSRDPRRSSSSVPGLSARRSSYGARFRTKILRRPSNRSNRSHLDTNGPNSALRHFVDLMQEPQVSTSCVFTVPLKPGDMSDGSSVVTDSPRSGRVTCSQAARRCRRFPIR